MAILKAVDPKKARAKNLKNIVKYVLQDKKTEEKLTFGKDINVFSVADDMQKTKDYWGKNTGREYYHIIQSFPPNEKITPEQALELGKKFIENSPLFDKYEVLIATHKDKEHCHNHFIINSVSYVDGKKFQYSRKDLAEMKRLQDEINVKYGFSKSLKKGQTINGTERKNTTSYNRDTYELLKKADKKEVASYVQNCALAILENIKIATSRDDFVQKMNKKGYSVKWTDDRNHVTFTDLEREKNGEQKKSIRLSKLYDYYNLQEFTKDFLTKEFDNNYKRAKIIIKSNEEHLNSVDTKTQTEEQMYQSYFEKIQKIKPSDWKEFQSKTDEYFKIQEVKSRVEFIKQNINSIAKYFYEKQQNEKQKIQEHNAKKPHSLTDELKGIKKAIYVYCDDNNKTYSGTKYEEYKAAQQDIINKWTDEYNLLVIKHNNYVAAIKSAQQGNIKDVYNYCMDEPNLWQNIKEGAKKLFETSPIFAPVRAVKRAFEELRDSKNQELKQIEIEQKKQKITQKKAQKSQYKGFSMSDY